MVKIVKSFVKIIIIMIIFILTVIPISNASSLEDIFTQGDEFIQQGKDGQILYEYEKNEDGSIKKDKEGNPIIKKDAKGNKIPQKDEEGRTVTVLDKYKLKEVVNQVYNVLFAIGVALSVIVGAVLGIKFMVGSVEEQAKIKETLIPYILGCLVVFGAFGIWKLVMTIGEKIF